jgi:hypothetical protein
MCRTALIALFALKGWPLYAYNAAELGPFEKVADECNVFY